MLRALKERAAIFAIHPLGPQGSIGGVLAGVLKQKLLRALKARAAIFAIPPPWGPRGYWWGIGWGIEAKIAARAPARAAIFAIHPLGPLGPPWGLMGALMGYWLLVIAGSNGSI